MALPYNVKECIKKNNYGVIVRYQPQPPLMIIQKGSEHSVPKTICTLTFELQEDGRTEILEVLENGEKQISDLNTLDSIMRLYIRKQCSKIGSGEGELKFEPAFEELAGASRHNL